MLCTVVDSGLAAGIRCTLSASARAELEIVSRMSASNVARGVFRTVNGLMPFLFESGMDILSMPKRIPGETTQRAMRLARDHLNDDPNTPDVGGV